MDRSQPPVLRQQSLRPAAHRFWDGRSGPREILRLAARAAPRGRAGADRRTAPAAPRTACGRQTTSLTHRQRVSYELTYTNYTITFETTQNAYFVGDCVGCVDCVGRVVSGASVGCTHIGGDDQ